MDKTTALDEKNREAYSMAFSNVCSYVEQTILKDGTIQRMTMLRDKYLEFLQQHTPQYYNEQFRTARLKEKLMNQFGIRLKFWLPSNRTASELVYAADLDITEAVETAFDAASSENKVLAEAAAILRRNIQCTHSRIKDTPWPPSASYLQSEATKPPYSLVDFLAHVISGRPAEQTKEKTQRLCGSFAEDICCATTSGRRKPPKHHLLGLTMHHLTGKAEIVSILNRYGHCNSHLGVLELETAMANHVRLESSLLPSNISTTGTKVVHLCWDNFDINEETPSGAGTTHTTHGIVIQELHDHAVVQTEHRNVPKSNVLSFKPPTYVKKANAEPCFADVSSSAGDGSDTGLTANVTVNEGIESKSNTLWKGRLWTLCGGMFNSYKTVPDWSGWLSKTTEGGNTVTESRIGYMQPIMHPITDIATVKQCLQISMEVTKMLQQEYTLVTMDLAAAKLAYNIIWGDRESYKNVIVNLGPFHTMCSYMGAIGKMMSGSGFEDIVVEAQLYASGSIDQVMSGKHYNRSVRVHQRMLDALERMLMACFQEHVNLEHGMESAEVVSNLASQPSAESLQKAQQNEDWRSS